MCRRGPLSLLFWKDCVHLATRACATDHCLNHKRLQYENDVSKWKMTTPPFTDAACLPAACTYVQQFQRFFFSWKRVTLSALTQTQGDQTRKSAEEAARTKQAVGAAGRRVFMWYHISLLSRNVFTLPLDAVGGEVHWRCILILCSLFNDVALPHHLLHARQACDVLPASSHARSDSFTLHIGASWIHFHHIARVFLDMDAALFTLCRWCRTKDQLPYVGCYFLEF